MKKENKRQVFYFANLVVPIVCFVVGGSEVVVLDVVPMVCLVVGGNDVVVLDAVTGGRSVGPGTKKINKMVYNELPIKITVRKA